MTVQGSVDGFSYWGQESPFPGPLVSPHFPRSYKWVGQRGSHMAGAGQDPSLCCLCIDKETQLEFEGDLAATLPPTDHQHS